jgi:DNA-binding CsgD family transcriptional regulator
VLIQAARSPETRWGDDLTEREREVLALMVDGLNNQQIAERLVIGLSTAKSHVSNVLSKLGVSTRTEAVTFALKIDSEVKTVKITGIHTLKVPPSWVWVKVETDEGLIGWGEPYLECHGDTVIAEVERLKPFLLGKDPTAVEQRWQDMYNSGTHTLGADQDERYFRDRYGTLGYQGKGGRAAGLSFARWAHPGRDLDVSFVRYWRTEIRRTG